LRGETARCRPTVHVAADRRIAINQELAMMSFLAMLWPVYVPSLFIVMGAVGEWVIGARMKRAVRRLPTEAEGPGRVLVFDPTHRRSSLAQRRFIAGTAGPARVIILREARWRRANLVTQNALRGVSSFAPDAPAGGAPWRRPPGRRAD
jgi:energy-converting hydrogenase Eha subunit E